MMLVFSFAVVIETSGTEGQRAALISKDKLQRTSLAESHARQRLMETLVDTVSDQREFDGAVIAFHDVTDMVNALSAKDDFVANVSHEFRTPLTAIKSYLALAMESPGLQPKEVENYLTIAYRNAERLSGLVSDLLSTRTMTVDRAPTDMVQLCAESLASADPACKKNDVVVNFDPQEPLIVGVDAVRIGQVLDNLISNAVKYSPHGGALSLRVWADGYAFAP
ncbi:sensor histidine kinase [Arthrobacter psychrochitiniphilus]|nr:histidine kinase dimerization/phospho-acceptor domain-containing protein [Arthrobacter psychrochitiniphilus]NYG16602.1 signal transduction histidine kinase [Arthrobacter psychrochitiniphilus]